MNRYYFKSFPEKGDIIYGTEEGSNRTHFFKVVESDESGALISPVYTRRIWENGEYGDAPDMELPLGTETLDFHFEESKNGRFKFWVNIYKPMSDSSVMVFLHPYEGGVVPVPPVELCGCEYSIPELQKAIKNMRPIQKTQLMNGLLVDLVVKAIRNNEMLANGKSYGALQEQQDCIGGFFAKIMEANK